MVRTLVLLIGFGGASLIGWLLRGWLWPAETPPPPSSTCRVMRGRMEQIVKARGIVKPGPTALARVGFPFPKDLARRIARLELVEGDTVRPGAELAQLDHEDLKASLDQLNAELQVFQRRLEALQLLEPIEIRSAEAMEAERRAQVQHAQRVHERHARLAKGSAASVEEADLAANEVVVARARLQQTENGLQQIRVRFRTDIAILQAQIDQARAAIRMVEVQIRWSTLRSPLAVPAQVFAVHQRQGELTSGQPTVPVLTLLDPNELQVQLFIDETDFGRLRPKQLVSLRLESYADEVVKGQIVRFLPQPILQENVVYYLAVVEVVPEQRPLLQAEMTVLAHVQGEIKESALWLPLAAVRSRPDGWYVLRPGSAGSTEVPVRIGWKDQGRVEIRAGLAEGDEVLLQP
jgi:HlyD family secretion protein